MTNLTFANLVLNTYQRHGAVKVRRQPQTPDKVWKGWTEDEIEEVKALYKKGIIRRVIAEMMGKTKASVDNRLYRLGYRKERNR